MIELIGGSIHCGKTSLADKITKAPGKSCLHIDSLEAIILSLYTSPEQLQERFPKSWMRGQQHSNEALFDNHTPEEVTQALITQSRSMWDAIQIFIGKEIEAGREFAIEDYHIHPEFVARCKQRFGAHAIATVFLIRKDLQKIVNYMQKHPRKGDWLIERGPVNIQNVARVVMLFSEFIEREAARYGMPCVRTDVDNFRWAIDVAGIELNKQRWNREYRTRKDRKT